MLRSNPSSSSSSSLPSSRLAAAIAAGALPPSRAGSAAIYSSFPRVVVRNDRRTTEPIIACPRQRADGRFLATSPPPSQPLPPIPATPRVQAAPIEASPLSSHTRDTSAAATPTSTLASSLSHSSPTSSLGSGSGSPCALLGVVRGLSHDHHRMPARQHRSQDQDACLRPSVPILSAAAPMADGKSVVRPRPGTAKSAPAGPCISTVTGAGTNTLLSSAAAAPPLPTLPPTATIATALPTTTRSGRPPIPVVFSRLATPSPDRGIRIEDWAIFTTGNNKGASTVGSPHPSPTDSYVVVPAGGGEDRDQDAKTGKKAARTAGASGGNKLLGDIKHRLRNILNKGLQMSASVSFKEKVPAKVLANEPTNEPANEPVRGEVAEAAEAVDAPPRQTKQTITLRIKNNHTGSCIFEITKVQRGGDEILTPIEDIANLFPHNKLLPRQLADWNRHFQNPPRHWITNFVPLAYLKRGFTLSEDVCEYFSIHTDGRAYRIEYEPIGHRFCLVGTTYPPPFIRKSRRGAYYGGPWESERPQKYLA